MLIKHLDVSWAQGRGNEGLWKQRWRRRLRTGAQYTSTFGGWVEENYHRKLTTSRASVEKAVAPHPRTLAWKIPWTEEPGRLQSTGSLRVGHDWATSLSLFTFMHWRRKWQPTPVFLPGESQGRGAWWAAFYGVTESQTRLRRLSSSSRGSERARNRGEGGVTITKRRDVIEGGRG